MKTINHKIENGEAFCWSIRDSYTGDLVIYVDICGNMDERCRPSLYYSARHFKEWNQTHNCKYFCSLKTHKNYDIGALPVEDLQKLFEEEAL